MKEERARLARDLPVIGEGVPMASGSMKPIDVGDVLYSGHAQVSGYRAHELEIDVETHAWRVFQINYKERYFRIRNRDGCEESIHHGDSGCPKLKLFHNFDDLRKVILRQLTRETQKTEKKINERKELLGAIQSDRATVTKMEAPKAPANLEFKAA